MRALFNQKKNPHQLKDEDFKSQGFSRAGEVKAAIYAPANKYHRRWRA